MAPSSGKRLSLPTARGAGVGSASKTAASRFIEAAPRWWMFTTHPSAIIGQVR